MRNLRKVFLQLLIVLMSMSGMTAFAGNGSGNGNGSSDGGGDGGGDAQLQLESSTPDKNAKDVAIDATIDLIFSNNVVNLSVADNNKTCFQLLNSKEEEIEIEVVMGDDQVDPSIKNNISIKPMVNLDEAESYTLIIKKKLQAKNGSTLNDEIHLEFSTVGKGATNSTLIIGIVGVIVVILVGGIIIQINKKRTR